MRHTRLFAVRDPVAGVFSGTILAGYRSVRTRARSDVQRDATARAAENPRASLSRRRVRDSLYRAYALDGHRRNAAIV